MEKRKKTVMSNREFTLSFFMWIPSKILSFLLTFTGVLILYFLAVGALNLLSGMSFLDELLLETLYIGLGICTIVTIFVQVVSD